MLRRTFLASTLALTACGPQIPRGPVRPGVLGDRAPVAFAGRAPMSYPVKGIDVARFQKSVDWNAARAAGVRFAFIKATEGGDRFDPMFREHWRGAQRAGMAHGAYHFYYFCTDAATQARWFIRNVPQHKGMLPPVLDLEWNAFSPTCQLRPEGAIVRREARIFLDMLERHYGQRPIVYTTPGFYRDTDLGKMRGEEFWLRSTAKSLREAYPGQSWRFWQFTATGILPGTPGDVDINVFRGSPAEWDAWLARRRVG